MAARNRIVKGILIAVGALAGIVVLALILLVVFFPSERIRAFAEAQAETYIDRPVAIGNIGVAFWPYLGARIEGVTIGNDPELTGEPLFSLGRIVVSVDLWKLITNRELRVREVLIDRPRATVIIDEDGRSSLDGLFVEQPEIEVEEEPALAVDTTEQVMGIPVALLVDRFRIADARIHYLDRQSDTELLIDGLSETLSLAIDATTTTLTLDGELVIAGLTVGAEGQGIGPTSIQVGHRAFVDVPADSAAFGLDIGLAGIPLSVSGAVRTMTERPEVFAHVKTGDMRLDRFLQQVTLAEDNQLARMDASGSVMLDLTVHTFIDTTDEQQPLDVHGILALKDIRLKHPDLPKAIDRISGEVRISPDAVEVREFQVRAGASSVDIGALLTAWQSEMPLLARSRIDVGIVLDELADVVELPEGTEVGGSIGLTIAASGPVNDPLGLTLDGTLSLRDIRAAIAELPVPIDRIAGDVHFNGNRISIPDIGIWLGSSEIHITDTEVRDFLVLALPEEYPNRRAQATLNIRGPMLNLDEIIPPDEEEKPALEDTTLLIPPILLPHIDIAAHVRIDSLIILELPFTALRIDAGAGSERANASGRITAFEGDVEFGGFLDYSAPDDPAYRANWNVASVQANAILATLAGFDDRLYGTAYSAGRIDGRGARYGDLKRNLVMNLDFQAGNGYLNNWEVVKETGGKLESAINRVRGGLGTDMVQRMGLHDDRFFFGQLDGEAGLRNETLTLRDIGLQAGEHEWRTNGTVGSVFDTVNALNVSTHLTLGTSTTRQLADAVAAGLSLATPVTSDDILRNLEPPNHLRIELTIRGTTEEPDVSVTDITRPLRDAAENAVRAKLRQARDQITEEAERRAREAREKAEAEAERIAQEARERAEREAQEAREKAEEEARKRVEEAKEEAKDRVRDFFRR